MADLESELRAALVDRDAISFARSLMRERAEDTATDERLHSLLVDLQAMLAQHAAQVGLYNAFILLDVDGEIVLTTAEPKGEGTWLEEPAFACGRRDYCVEMSSRRQTGRALMYAALPVNDVDGQVVGVLVGEVNASLLTQPLTSELVDRPDSEVYLVDREHVPLTALGHVTERTIKPNEGIRQAVEHRTEARGVYVNYAGMPVVGLYRWIPTLESVLVVEQRRTSAFSTAFAMLAANVGVAIAVAAGAIAVALAVTRSITNPLAELAGMAGRVAGGDLDLKVALARNDEIGSLARAFDTMATRLREVVRDLERTVAERTVELELRSSYLEAAAEIGRMSAAILDPEQLPQSAVELIRDRFDLSYVSLYLLEEAKLHAVLQAETAERGYDVVAQRRIRIPEGVVGWAIRHGQARVDQNGGDPEETPWAAALPLRSRGRVLGAILVQSARPGTFDRDMLVALETVTDQVAIALDNARLFQESQAALASARRISGELSREAWAASVRSRTDLAFRSDNSGTARLGQTWRPELDEAVANGEAVVFSRQSEEERGEALAVPVRMQGQVIGVLDTYKPAEMGGWTSDQIALVEQIASQLSEALENARLYEETQRRAIREQQLREIGSRMQSTVDLDAIMRIAIENLAAALDVPSAFVQLYEAQVIAEE
jgi:GAF domain-containing protein/HAMP domain-containing protein